MSHLERVALVVRDYYPPQQAGQRVGTVIMATLSGMAFGGWGSGAIFDWTGSYNIAFIHGIGWNLVNVWVVLFLLGHQSLILPAAIMGGVSSGISMAAGSW